MAQKAYYGRGARTFGNPGGATSGDGSFNGGGGGGPTLAILAGDGGAGAVGFEQTFCGVVVFGAITSGALPPFVTPGAPFAIGTDVAGLGPSGFSVNVFGALAQNVFTSVQIIQLGLTLATAAADFFTNGGGCGPSTIWTWVAVPPLIIGNPYGFVFA